MLNLEQKNWQILTLTTKILINFDLMKQNFVKFCPYNQNVDLKTKILTNFDLNNENFD